MSVAGVVSVKDQAGVAVPGAAVTVAWTSPTGATHTQTVTTGAIGNASFSTQSGRGTYTVTVTNVAKGTYTFDPATSVLTRSITR